MDLIVVSAGGGKVKYMVGESVETTAEQLTARLGEIEKAKADPLRVYNEAVSQINTKTQAAIDKIVSEAEAQKAAIDQATEALLSNVKSEQVKEIEAAQVALDEAQKAMAKAIEDEPVVRALLSKLQASATASAEVKTTAPVSNPVEPAANNTAGESQVPTEGPKKHLVF